MFIEFQKQKLSKVIFGNNGRGNILDNVYLVNDLKYNLLSVS